MIYLTLTSQEVDLLHHSLTHSLQHSPEQAEENLLLLHKLQLASDDSHKHQCPICLTSFSQLLAGRTAIYCSNSCKQKAFRQRVNQRKRQFGPYKPKLT